MEFPGFDRLFELRDPCLDRPFRGRFGQHDIAGLVTAAAFSTSDPVELTWAMGRSVPGDVVWTTSGSPIIVSSRVAALFRSQRFTGWRTYPVELQARNGEIQEGYYGLAITGRHPGMDIERCAIEIAEYPGGFFPEFRGFFFEPSSWSGDDFTIQEKGFHIVVTERVVSALTKARIGNIEPIRLCDRTWSTSIFETTPCLPTDFYEKVRVAYAKRDLQPPEPYR